MENRDAVLYNRVDCGFRIPKVILEAVFCILLNLPCNRKGRVMEKVPMTTAGFESLKEELRWRQQQERPRIIEAISEARAHGDLSENAEYHAAKEAQSHNEGRINELEDYIARAEVINVSRLSGDKIKFGATIKLLDEDTEEKRFIKSLVIKKLM